MSNAELKPCPFCGGTDLSSGGDDKFAGYHCKTCGATGPNHFKSHEWNTRSPQTTDGQVKVKPLEWAPSQQFTVGYDGVPEYDYSAKSVEGRYSVEFYPNHKRPQWVYARNNHDIANFDTKEDAKAAAQADYESRILSALEPADTGTIQALAEKAGDGTLRALIDVINERYRQVDVEGWTTEHDDQHNGGQLAQAAAAYAFYNTDAEYCQPSATELFPTDWSLEWFKPTEARRDMVKAAALILAEIERLDRAEQSC